MNKDSRYQDRWARLRFSIIGPLLAAPPKRGELRSALTALSKKQWCHPITQEPVFFGLSTLERWYYAAKNEFRDPVGKLRRRIRKDAGLQPSVGGKVREVLRAQYREHKSWSWRLHYDNLAVVVAEDFPLGRLPSYSTICRYMKREGLSRQRRPRARSSVGAQRAAERLEQFEVRSFEVEYVNALWHADFHQGSKKVLTSRGEWVTPILLGVLDDRSRLACHVQWYLEETAKTFVHGFCQAIQKRGVPRSLMTDRGSAMMAAETQGGLERVGVVHQPTLPYSPYQNAKQEIFWATVEGRLVAMLEGCHELTLELLNEATQAWVEGDYNPKIHSEIGVAPLRRFLDERDVGRPSPGSDELRRFFRAETRRTLRKSDTTLSLKGKRFEVPSRYRHLSGVYVRYASWDLSTVDVVDARSGRVLCAIYPLDKTQNAEGKRRRLEPVSSEAVGEDLCSLPASAMAPLLKKLMAEYAATGLPPAYVPLDKEPGNRDALPEPKEKEGSE